MYVHKEGTIPAEDFGLTDVSARELTCAVTIFLLVLSFSSFLFFFFSFLCFFFCFFSFLFMTFDGDEDESEDVDALFLQKETFQYTVLPS